MANCYNVAGDSTSCSANDCIGSDCSGSYEVGGTVINDPDFGLEGFAGMSQDEFQQWFIGLHDWGTVYEGNANPGVSDPTYIDEDSASQLSELFQGYNTLEEMYLRGQNQENEIERTLQLEAWDEATNLLIEEKNARNQSFTDKQKELFMLNESFDDYVSSWQNKADITESVKRKRDLENQSTRPGRLMSDEKKLMDDTVKDVLNDFYSKQDFQDEKIKAKLSLMDTRTANIYNSSILKKQNDLEERQTKLVNDLNKADVKLHEQILSLREEYELDIYNTIEDLGITGAFFETEYENEPTNFECLQWSDSGECLNWNESGALGGDSNPDNVQDEGLCYMTTCDGTTVPVNCGEYSQGHYFVDPDACYDPESECIPILNLLGQDTGNCD